MKFLIVFLLFFSGFFNAQNMYYYRDLINKAEHSHDDAKVFLKRVSADYQKTKMPIFLALSGVGNFFLAKHSYNPINKISYFNKGKELLDAAAKKDANNLEIRFLRYLSQKKIPRFLGYHKNLAEDEKFLKTHYPESKDEDLVKEIKRYIK